MTVFCACGRGPCKLHAQHLLRSEREQRRDDDGEARVLDDGADLKRQALAAAGRQDEQAVAPGQRRFNRLALTGAKARVPKQLERALERGRGQQLCLVVMVLQLLLRRRWRSGCSDSAIIAMLLLRRRR
jgi:hypothetical protein